MPKFEAKGLKWKNEAAGVAVIMIAKTPIGEFSVNPNSGPGNKYGTINPATEFSYRLPGRDWMPCDSMKQGYKLCRAHYKREMKKFIRGVAHWGDTVVKFHNDKGRKYKDD